MPAIWENLTRIFAKWPLAMIVAALVLTIAWGGILIWWVVLLVQSL